MFFTGCIPTETPAVERGVRRFFKAFFSVVFSKKKNVIIFIIFEYYSYFINRNCIHTLWMQPQGVDVVIPYVPNI